MHPATCSYTVHHHQLYTLAALQMTHFILQLSSIFICLDFRFLNLAHHQLMWTIDLNAGFGLLEKDCLQPLQ